MLETDLLVFIRKFNILAAPYMITGSWASSLHGEPRTTFDVDIVVHLEPTQIQRLTELFPPEEFYCPPIDVMQREARRPSKGQFNIIHLASGTKADLYVSKGDALDKWGLEYSRVHEVAGENIRVAPPEYIIIRKMEFFKLGESEKHLRDIRGILAVSGKDIDMVLLEREIGNLGLDEVWQRVRT